jgi:hypothetical protein
MTILPQVRGTYSCPNIMNSRHPTVTTTLCSVLLPPFTNASPTSVTVMDVTSKYFQEFSGFHGGRLEAMLLLMRDMGRW